MFIPYNSETQIPTKILTCKCLFRSFYVHDSSTHVQQDLFRQWRKKEYTLLKNFPLLAGGSFHLFYERQIHAADSDPAGLISHCRDNTNLYHTPFGALLIYPFHNYVVIKLQGRQEKFLLQMAKYHTAWFALIIEYRIWSITWWFYNLSGETE